MTTSETIGTLHTSNRAQSPASFHAAPDATAITTAAHRGGFLMDLDIDTARLKPALRNRTRNLRACTICGAPAIGSRCTKHPRTRPTTSERGYDADHQRLRAELDPIVQAGNTRCAHPDCDDFIQPGTPWDLAHNQDRTGYLGPMHATCNRRTAQAAA